MSLVSLANQTFSADNFASNTFDTSLVINPDHSATIGNPDTAFSEADNGLDDSYKVLSVDLSTANSYRLGTIVVDNFGPGGDIGTLTGDILADNNGQVLLGFSFPSDGPDQYSAGYLLLSNTNINNPTYPIQLSFDPNAYQAPCFARGTRIATPAGEVAVENIGIGDVVLTESGAARAVTWVGHRFVDLTRHANADLVRPIRIMAGAFADNVPSRDLVVSPDHNLFIEGVLIPAKCLVNGATVMSADIASVTYHHVELASHDVIIAEGMAAETYLDTGNRNAFTNEGVTVAHPDFSSAPDVNYFAWEANGCARLVMTGAEIDRARAVLDARIPSLMPAAKVLAA